MFLFLELSTLKHQVFNNCPTFTGSQNSFSKSCLWNKPIKFHQNRRVDDVHGNKNVNSSIDKVKQSIASRILSSLAGHNIKNMIY